MDKINTTISTGEPVTEQVPAVGTTITAQFLEVHHPSIRSLAKTLGISYSTLRYRVAHGIEACVALVCTERVQLKFVGLDGKARYTLNGIESKLYTARELIEKYRPDLLDAYDKHNLTGKYEPYQLNKEDLNNG